MVISSLYYLKIQPSLRKNADDYCILRVFFSQEKVTVNINISTNCGKNVDIYVDFGPKKIHFLILCKRYQLKLLKYTKDNFVEILCDFFIFNEYVN